MSQPSLNEYFTLTNDLLLKMILRGYTAQQDPLTGEVCQISVSSQTLKSAKSIMLPIILNNSIGASLQIITAYRSLSQRIKDAVLELIRLQNADKRNAVDTLMVITYVQAPLSRTGLQRLCSIQPNELGLSSALADKIQLKTIPLPTVNDPFQLPLSAEEQYRWFIKEARPHSQSVIVRQLTRQNPMLAQLQIFLDYLSDQPLIRELAKKRYLRMQEIIQEEEKAAMRA